MNRNSSSVGNRLKYVGEGEKSSKFDDDVGGLGWPKMEDSDSGENWSKGERSGIKRVSVLVVPRGLLLKMK